MARSCDPTRPASPRRWPQYLIEGAGLGTFMISALVVTALLEHPASPVRAALPAALGRRAVAGLAMGATAAALIYSTWGQRSGAHMNPAVTLAFLRLGKIVRRDAAFYVLAQFAGGLAGIAVAGGVLGPAAADPAVNYAATVPGSGGVAAAFVGELVISFAMMAAVLLVSNSERFAGCTGAVAACLIAAYITVEAPLSGMSMNPARSLASAVAAGAGPSLWIYFVAPPAGMLAAAELYRRRFGPAAVRCAKLHHPAHGTCHFTCARAGAAPRRRRLDPALTS
jgi:aquaporin Z